MLLFHFDVQYMPINAREHHLQPLVQFCPISMCLRGEKQMGVASAEPGPLADALSKVPKPPRPATNCFGSLRGVTFFSTTVVLVTTSHILQPPSRVRAQLRMKSVTLFQLGIRQSCL